MKKRIRLSLVACFIWGALLHAQQKDVVFEQITNESGRSLGFITGIVQDEEGFMWFATRKGLYRYNGYSYKLFRHQKKDSLSLPFNDIAHIYYDQQNNFWLRHYDELAVYKNERQVFAFDTLTRHKFDIEVKVVQDKEHNYWVGPSGNGLILYQEANKSLRSFNCPPPTYAPQAWHLFDSLLLKPGVAKVLEPGNNCDTLIPFTLTQAGYYLIGCTGEIDSYGMYDYGYLTQNSKKLWELSADKSMWAGADTKNRFEAKPLYLKAGNYALHYKSDRSHGCGQWEGEAPDKTGFCGIKLVNMSPDLFQEVKQKYLKASRDSNYIASAAVKDLLVDNLGNFWALTDQGLEQYDYKTRRFHSFTLPFQELFGRDMSQQYMTIFQDSKGIFWIGSRYGLLMYDHIWGRTTLFQNEAGKQVLTSNAIFSIFEDYAGKIWIGTDQGINIYDKERHAVEKIQANNKNRLYDNRIIQIFEDNAHNIWVATFEGLNRLIKDPFTYTNLDYNADHDFPAFYDQSANIWYALKNAVYKYSRTYSQKETFRLPDKLFDVDEFTGEANYYIADMVRDKAQNIWLATDNRVSRLNALKKEVDYSYATGAVIVQNDSIKNKVSHLAFSKTNEILAFSANGVHALKCDDLGKRSFTPFPLAYDFIDEVNVNYVKNILTDANGNVWVRTADGIYMYNPFHYTLELVYAFTDRVKGGPLDRGRMATDKYGNIWFAVLPDLFKIKAETGKVDHFSCEFEHDWGTSHVKIGKDLIWIYGANGVYAYAEADSTFDYISVDDGLIDNNINEVIEDSLGYVWFAGLKGLSKFDLKERRCKTYFTASDFTTHRFLGNAESFKVGAGEKLLFTTNGIVSFYPDSINGKVPEIVIDRFTIRGKEYRMDSLIYQQKSLELRYDQNFIGLEFAALDYTEPSENRYRYILEGLEDEWNEVDATNRRASYSGIAPGKYVFRVQGSNNDKVWNETGVSLKIMITPPWYKTILAYILYGILLVMGVFFFVRWREQKLIEEKRILEEKVKERTLEIEMQKEELAKKNQDNLDSLRYAKRIQQAILPPLERLTETMEEHFLLWRPQNIVSGDYHWSARKGDHTVVVAADCTGHGVPGAFMSMLGVAFLNEIVNNKGLIEPDAILNLLRTQVIRQMSQEHEEQGAKDGMDISLYVVDHKAMRVSFSGAYNGLYIIRKGELTELKADRMPVGDHIRKEEPFTVKTFDLEKGDCLYNFSDGYPDQFGGEDGRKFMSKNFKKLLLQIYEKPMAEQKALLNARIEEWMGGEEQIDDIIVIGVRV